jgi:predicted permease
MEREMEAELKFHTDAYANDLVRSGMPREEATRRARLEFGGLERAKEECRDATGVTFLESLAQDIRYGVRMLRKSAGFTVVAVLTLALGIGANTAIFGLVNGIVLRPLPYAEPDRLVSITDSYPEGALVAMRGSLKDIDVAGYTESTELNLTGRGEPVRLYGSEVSAELFSVLRASAEIGRTFEPGEDQPARGDVVILSHGLWQSEFGGNRNIISHSITVGGIDRRIVGVMPQDFRFPLSKTQLWIPLSLDPRNIGDYWGGPFMPVIGRLRNGATIEHARAELRATLPHIRPLFPWKMPDSLWAGSTVIPLLDGVVGDSSETLLVLFGAITLVLLIACANVANLLLSRAVTRQREMAVRAALGAARWRICRQLLAESVVLAILGGTLGLLLTFVGLRSLKLLLPASTPRLYAVSIDWHVLAFTAAVAIATGLIFGLAPALQTSRIDLTNSLKSAARNTSQRESSHLRSLLAVIQIATAVVLVIAAGLMVKSLWKLSNVNPGFRTESIVAARITPNESFCKPLARCENFYRELVQRVRAMPGVEDAALVDVLPLDGRLNAFAASVEGHPRDPRDPQFVLWESIITPGYLRMMGIPLLRGRAFTAADSAPGAPAVTLITESTAKRFWPNQNPIGKHVKRSWTNDWITVIGEVGDVYEHSLALKVPVYCDGAVYDPYGNNIGSGGGSFPIEMSLVARVLVPPPAYADALRRIVSGLNPDVPVSEVRDLRTMVAQSVSAPRSTAMLFTIFATLAFILGAIGIYGVVSYSVAQRTSEIGVRVAMGAQRHNVVQLVMSQGARLALAGTALGVGGAFAATRFISSLLYGVSPTDPATFMAVTVLLALVALAACYVPARRAMQVDPIVALRHE